MTADLREREPTGAPSELSGVVLVIALIAILTLVTLLTV